LQNAILGDKIIRKEMERNLCCGWVDLGRRQKQKQKVIHPERVMSRGGEKKE